MSDNYRSRLQDRVAIVTGSSRGLGRATALVLAREGAKVVVNYRKNRKKADEVVSMIEDGGGIALSHQADVCDRGAVKEMVEKAIAEYGGVDILVNNAGLLRGGGPLSELRDGDLDLMFNTNVKGVLICTQAVLPHMLKMQRGKIVNISSVAGLGTSILPGNIQYAITKGAVNILTKRLALELGPHGICVNAIAPGFIRTDMALGGLGPAERGERVRYFEDRSMLGRVGEPEDIANAVLFLASEESNFITGQILAVDGGRIDFITHSL